MKSIAIISDIHGNLPALEVVLEDIKARDVDTIYCLGDLVDFAPWHNEVIAMIRDLMIPCIMGNHDERVAFDHDIIPITKHNHEETTARTGAISYTKQTITDECRDFLKMLPEQLKFTVSVTNNNIDVLLVHGSTRNNREYIYEDHDLTDIQQMLIDGQADVIIMGHTHHPYIRKIEATENSPAGVLINAGSVGRSREAKQLASYVVLHIDEENIQPEIIKLSYPVHDVIKGIEESAIPDFYAGFLKRGIVLE
ncbi:metallophosphoesterase family protein [Flavobacterium cerinum]|uniref:Metallophosphoesterase n=1 Tax=Flavobacterium cerinum TaxID=2502784 RepID=A0A3S3QFJ6_9FLAO|nr:metallophosphoesterase family protein [Flavobacterium cerinum]RWW92263.1 metallophosphoesterase [Flavobacterium cerinum]